MQDGIIGNGEPSLVVFATDVNLMEYEDLRFRDFGVFAVIDGELRHVWFWISEAWPQLVFPYMGLANNDWQDLSPSLLVVISDPGSLHSTWLVTYEDGELKVSWMRHTEIGKPQWYIEFRERE